MTNELNATIMDVQTIIDWLSDMKERGITRLTGFKIVCDNRMSRTIDCAGLINYSNNRYSVQFDIDNTEVEFIKDTIYTRDDWGHWEE